MRFDPNILDDIRNRLPVSEVVGQRVKLRRQGREWVGLSPFTSEKTASFTVNDVKGFYHCFSSGQHGDIFGFLMETEGLSFPEAVEQLADEAGVTLPRPDPKATERHKAQQSLSDVCTLAAEFYSASLQGKEGTFARDYAQRRGLKPETITEFQIGYAPASRDALKQALAKKNITTQQMIAAGLLIKPDDGRPTYDRFRDRLMIPISDQKGRIIAFGGRVLNPEAMPKYLNSPETALFHKGSTLYNAHRARKAAYEKGKLIVVEGYMDAIMAYQAGAQNIVATLGTAFTPEQISALWRLAAEPVICFDGDRAGLAAAHRAVDRILPVLKGGNSFNFTFLPQGKDPDDVIRQRGAAALNAAIDGASPLIDVLWDREIRGLDLRTPERRAALEQRLKLLTSEIRDSSVATHYATSIRSRLSNHFWQLEREARGFDGKKSNAVSRDTASGPAPDTVNTDMQDLIGLAIAYPFLIDGMEEAFASAELDNRHLAELRDLILTHTSEQQSPDTTALISKLPPDLHNAVDKVFGFGSEEKETGHALRQRMRILTHDPPQRFLEDQFQTLLLAAELANAKSQLDLDLAEAENSLDDKIANRISALSLDIHRLNEELTSLTRDLAEQRAALRSSSPARV